jgi:hypothetical protein
MTRLEQAEEAYFDAFKVPPPAPVGPSDEAIADALEGAVAKGEPLPDDFDWWGYVPAGGAA